MKAKLYILFIALSLLVTDNGYPANAEFTVTVTAINKILDRIGDLSNSGTSTPVDTVETPGLFEVCHQVGAIACPGLDRPELGFDLGEIPVMACETKGGGVVTVPVGEPVPWQWWIRDATVSTSSGAMNFTATVISNVDGHWSETTRTVGATVGYEPVSDTLVLAIEPFDVHLTVEVSPGRSGHLVTIEAAKYYSMRVPITAQKLNINMPNDDTKNVTAAVESASNKRYLATEVKVDVDVDF